ncbi:MAG: hypothetical protein KAS76_00180 [Thermoplasmatales archaeon]|nr:hypothetical protein [Thermoplasmatales archaeon]
MKKNLAIFGAVATAFLIISSVTAVSQVNSDPVMNHIERAVKYEQLRENINEVIESIKIDGINLPAEVEGEEATSSQAQAIPSNIDEILDFLDMDNFIDFFTGDEFIDVVTSDFVKDMIESDLFLELFNLPEVQEYIFSDEFQDLYESEEAQDFLDELESTYILTDTLGMLVFWGSLILGMSIWYSTIGAICGILGIAGTLVVVLGLLENWMDAYESMLPGISEMVSYIFGPFDKMVSIVGTIASFLSSIGAAFLAAMVALATMLEFLVIDAILYGVAILPPIVFALIMLSLYSYLADVFGLTEYAQTYASSFSVCQTYLATLQSVQNPSQGSAESPGNSGGQQVNSLRP